MKFIYVGRDLEVSDALKERAEKKLAKLARYFQDDVEALIRLSQQRGGRNTAEITISVGSLLLRAEESTGDMYASIDGAVDKLNRQIRRHRTKLEKRLRVTLEPETAEEAPAEDENYRVVRTKTFSVKPMNLEDAIAQMDLLGHNFYLFQNEETGTMCVLYRRNDGDYGLLKPE